jgi:hypothetical protein
MCGPSTTTTTTTTNWINKCTLPNMNIGDQLCTFISSIIVGERSNKWTKESERERDQFFSIGFTWQEKVVLKYYAWSSIKMLALHSQAFLGMMRETNVTDKKWDNNNVIEMKKTWSILSHVREYDVSITTPTKSRRRTTRTTK